MKSFQRYAAVNPVNIEIWTDPFYKDYVRVVEKIPGVDNVEGQHVMLVRSREWMISGRGSL